MLAVSKFAADFAREWLDDLGDGEVSVLLKNGKAMSMSSRIFVNEFRYWLERRSISRVKSRGNATSA